MNDSKHIAKYDVHLVNKQLRISYDWADIN